MEAIKSGDKDLAEETATNHIRNAYSNIVANGLKESYPEEWDHGLIIRQHIFEDSNSKYQEAERI